MEYWRAAKSGGVLLVHIALALDSATFLWNHRSMDAANDPDLSFLETPERERLFSASLKFNRQHPEIGIKQHLWMKSITLGEEMATCRRIYLDMKYWILARDVVLGRCTDPGQKRLHDLLASLVAEGKIICPISDYCWIELFKQRDGTTLSATARIIDELGKGVCIKFHQERLEIELLHFLREKTSLDSPVLPLVNLVWTRVYNAIGTNYPIPHAFPQDEVLVIQKSFVDYCWTMTLSEIVRTLHMSPEPPPIVRFNVSSLNDGKFSHADEIGSFEDARVAELAGIVDAYAGTFRTVLRRHYETCKGKRITPEEDREGETKKWIQNHVFRPGGLTTELPFINIQAGIHAMFRWDRHRKLKENDIWDFGHAAAALPYYSLFLTEKSLKHLVTSPPLCFDKLYGVRVIADEDEAIAALECL